MHPICGTAFTDDSGWGCMIRCGQMLAASALAAHLLGPEWANDELDPEVRKFILGHFLDTPSSLLSLHSLVGVAESGGRRIGEWHTPSITARALTHQINTKMALGIKAYCAIDMTVERDIVEGLLDGNKLIIFIPMRLGVERLNPIYADAILEMLSDPFSLGIAG